MLNYKLLSAGLATILVGVSYEIRHLNQVNKKLVGMTMYYADTLDKNKVAITEFDKIALEEIVRS